MAKLMFFTDDAIQLCEVDLKQIAEYLGCNLKRLQTALEHLAESPSYIEYAPGVALITALAANMSPEELKESKVLRAMRDILANEAEANARLDKIDPARTRLASPPPVKRPVDQQAARCLN